jgi:hypothetical protein
MEVLISLALFAIVLVAALPTLSHAGRNLAYAQDGHAAHLRAQSVMLLVRDALADGVAPETVIHDYSNERDGFPYTVWINGGAGGDRVFTSPGAPSAALSMDGIALFSNRSVIYVVVWNEHGHVAGRAMGFVRL